MLEDMQVYFLLVGLFMLILLITIFIQICKRCKGNMQKLRKKAYDKFVWNGTIRSFSIAYMKLLVTFGDQIRLLIQGDQVQSPLVEKLLGLAFFIFMIAYCFFTWNILLKHKRQLEDKEFKKRYGTLYTDISFRPKDSSF